MKAELSHYSFINQNKMTGVYLQQGRMITDRDFNALCETLKAQFENIGDKSIGTGVPRHDGLLHNFTADQSPASEWSAEFPTNGGWVVADGVLGEARSHGYNLDIDVEDEADDVDDLTVTTQRDLPEAMSLFGQNREGIYYVDIWDEVVNALDDSDIMDPAFHGADSCFTTQRRVQIKKCHESAIKAIEDKIADQDFSCGYEINSKIIPTRGNCGFSIDMSDTANGTDPCNPCEGEVEIEQELGNFLFRLEVHAVDFNADGMPIKIALKWSRENGSYEVEGGAGTVFAQDYSYEMFSQETDLEMGVPAGGFSHASDRYRHLFHGSNSGAYIDSYKARRWDGFAVLDIEGNLERGFHRGVPLPVGNYKVGNGLKLSLGNLDVTLQIDSKLILTGDCWLALARSRTTEKIRALSNLPIGIKHHYCLLGYTEDGQIFTGLTPGDKRRLNFPSLSCLHAEDISYKSNCEHAEGATNVKEALDLFCEAIPGPYLSLRMSEGTGQEAHIGHDLPGPVRVLVENEDGEAVPDIWVRFSIQPPFTGTDEISDGSNSSTSNLAVKTDASGYAEVRWSLNGSPGLRRLKLSIIGTPQSNAGQLFYSALGKEKSHFPLVDKITWVDQTPYKNDWTVDLDTLSRGFTIHFLDEIIQELITPDVLTLKMEFLGKEDFRNLYELIVCGDVQTTERTATFIPHKGFIQEALKSMMLEQYLDCSPSGIRLQIKLRGPFVFNLEGRPFDAFVPGMPARERIAPNIDVGLIDNPVVDDYITGTVIDAVVSTPYNEYLANSQTNTTPRRVVAAQSRRSKTSSERREKSIVDTAAIIATKANYAASTAYQEYVPRPPFTIADRPDFAGIYWPVGKRRIALNYAERGVGHPSDLESWFYLRLPEANTQPGESVGSSTVAVNQANGDILVDTDIFSFEEASTVLAHSKHIRNGEHLSSILGKVVPPEIEKRLNYSVGYMPPPDSDERYMIHANSDSADHLRKTGLLNCHQVSDLLENQPKWVSLAEIYDALKPDKQQIGLLEGRIIVDDPNACDDDPKDPHNPHNPNDPGPGPNDPPKGDPVCKEIIDVNNFKADQFARNFNGTDAERVSNIFVRLRSELISENKFGFGNYQDLMGYLKRRQEFLLLQEFQRLEKCLEFKPTESFPNPCPEPKPDPEPDPDPTPPASAIFWVNDDGEDKMAEIFDKDISGEDRAAFFDFRNNLRSPIKSFADLIQRLSRRKKDKTHMQNLIKVFRKFKEQLGYVKDLP